MANHLSKLLKVTDNEYASVVEDGIAGSNTSVFDTGSYMLNALCSGSLFGGITSKITVMAGEEAVGKTFIALNIAKKFLEHNKKNIVLYFESESAITEEMLKDRGFDTTRFGVIPVATIEEFRTQVARVLKDIEENDTRKKDKYEIMVFLDSLGGLSTQKEIEDITEGNAKRDMTRAQLVRGAFRALTLKLGKLDVPLVVTNHVYDVVGSYFPSKELAGGGGLKYAASTIITFRKKKDKDGTDQVGIVIPSKVIKSRFTKENQEIELRLNFTTGLDPYYGLLELAEEYEIIKKSGNRYELADGTKVFGKQINAEPKKYFDKKMLEKLEKCAKAKFSYGSTNNGH